MLLSAPDTTNCYWPVPTPKTCEALPRLGPFGRASGSFLSTLDGVERSRRQRSSMPHGFKPLRNTRLHRERNRSGRPLQTT